MTILRFILRDVRFAVLAFALIGLAAEVRSKPKTRGIEQTKGRILCILFANILASSVATRVDWIFCDRV